MRHGACSSMATVAEQSDRFLADLATRRTPVKPATLKAYGGYLRNWILPLLGGFQLSEIDNGVLKRFVTSLVNQRLSPATVNLAVTTLKMLVKSETDENGNILNQREWNADFPDLPAVDPTSQRAPIISGRQLNAALSKAAKPYQAFYALQAGSGLSLRRFRTTHLENMSVPRVLVDHWTGHATKTITGIGARKNWCRRAGLGFQLPGLGEDIT